MNFRIFAAVFSVMAFTALADESWFGAPIPASGEDGRPDCGMTAARIFDAPIPGLRKLGKLVVPNSTNVFGNCNSSIGFEGLDRGLFNPERCYDTLATTGVKWARICTMWSRCEKEKGVYDFSVLDGIVENLTKRGIRPWVCVTYGNTLYMTNCYTGAAVGCVPIYYGKECQAAWRRYVRELARRYKGKITHWEIWNEPNLKHFWQPKKPNAKDYLKFLKLTSKEIRKEIPDAKIGASTASPALNKWEKSFFDAGGAKFIDFWCSHAYSCVPEQLRRKQRIASGDTSDYVTVLKEVRKFIDERGGAHIEFWQGESGFPSWFPEGHWLFGKGVCKKGWQSQANQAKWLLRRFLTDRRAGIIRSSFFQMADVSRAYSMATTTQTHPAEHGIVNGWTYKPKMSYYAFGHYNALLSTAQYDPSIEVSISPVESGGVATMSMAFRSADNTPMFLYYTQFDFSKNYVGKCYTPMTDAELTVPSSLAPKNPVLVDMLRGGVYKVSSFAEADGCVKYKGLPLVDYPLLLTDVSAVKFAPASSN